MIKVTHLISSLRRGGRERQLSIIVSQTNPDNYHSKIIYLNEAQNSYFDEYAVKKNAFPLKSAKFIPRLFELNKILKKDRPQIVYSWGNLESLFILLLKPFHKFKFINGSVRHGIRSKKFSHYFRTLILHLSENIIANSYAGLKANNLKKGYVIYNGIEDKFINPVRPFQKTLPGKKQYGITESVPLLISVANIVPYKDYYSILYALKLIKEQGHDFFYLILGDGPLRAALQQRIELYNLQDRIKILGNVQAVFDYLAMADIFIHSSKGEGCSNAVLEAMAAGLPVIASNTGGTSEIVSAENGFLFEYKNYRQLAECIKICLDDALIRHKLGENSRQKIQNNFTIAKMMTNYYRVIEEVIKK